ncbi:MAG TPA: 16S rRNA (adenine(1518)-N(6)/adenine(1519)-N(6))-dimethyltransferase RsmA [Sphingomicrobium sp.]|nr:16S rRNA (adenine(1518)-N(6)/adenine(1519)-N(6))-dimethyltransferase RsmA [Sphingomicrobium sp.]
MSKATEPLREVIARHGLSASKALGQNFILDRQLLVRIAAIPGSLQGQKVYEVGPGPGGLTRALLDAGAAVTAVERDRRCIPALEELQQGFGWKLQVIEADALKIDERELLGTGTHVVANLPYNVGTALLLKWLSGDWPPWWRSLTLMFQKEVAERIVAQPGSEAYGRLSVAAQWRAQPRIAMAVSRSAFVPPPKVTSAVVHIVPGEAPGGVDARVMARLTKAAFGQRRKMLRSSLKSFPGAAEAAEAIGIDLQRRAETLSVDEYVNLARALTRSGSEISPSSEPAGPSRRRRSGHG